MAGVVATITTMAYLLMAGSVEFAAFSPFRVDPVWVSVAALLSGLVAVLLTHGISEKLRMAIMAVVVVAPILTYGMALITLWVTFAGFELIDVFLVGAGQRMFAQLITRGVMAAVSMMLSLIITAMYW